MHVNWSAMSITVYFFQVEKTLMCMRMHMYKSKRLSMLNDLSDSWVLKSKCVDHSFIRKQSCAMFLFSLGKKFSSFLRILSYLIIYWHVPWDVSCVCTPNYVKGTTIHPNFPWNMTNTKQHLPMQLKNKTCIASSQSLTPIST